MERDQAINDFYARIVRVEKATKEQDFVTVKTEIRAALNVVIDVRINGTISLEDSHILVNALKTRFFTAFVAYGE